MADSRNEDLLENILGASNEYGEPQSRNEAILQNILGEQNELQPPVSRIEELLMQILEQGGSGGNIGYQVTFTVDGEPYYIASCLQGESITAPPNPTKSGYAFENWQDGNGNLISFPYVPTADIEVTAGFIQVHTEIEVKNAGDEIYSYSGGTVTKLNGGTALYGFVTYQTTKKFLFLVSKDVNAVTMSANQMANNSITYNDETWYWAHSQATITTAMLHTAADVGPFENKGGGAPQIAKDILDYYFNVS